MSPSEKKKLVLSPFKFQICSPNDDPPEHPVVLQGGYAGARKVLAARSSVHTKYFSARQAHERQRVSKI